jgi:hypothetical protein
MLKAHTIYSLHDLQIARINEYLENFSSVIISSNTMFLQVKLFIGVTLTHGIFTKTSYSMVPLEDNGSTIPGFHAQITPPPHTCL